MGADPTIRLRRESRGTIQLEDVVSTISGEYLLEFTSEYSIPEDLHPELPGPEETIVDFPEGKVDVVQQATGEEYPTMLYQAHRLPKELEYRFFWVDERIFPTVVSWRTSAPKDEMPSVDTYSALDLVKDGFVQFDHCTESCKGEDRDPTPCRPREKSPLDFANEDPLPVISEGVGSGGQARDKVPHEIPPTRNPPTTEVAPDLDPEAAAMGSLVRKRRRERGSDGANTNAPPKVLRKDHASIRSEQSTHGKKSLTSMGLVAGSLFVTPTDAKSVFRDPHQECGHRGDAKPTICGEFRVREINLRFIHGRVARRYLSTGMGRKQQLPPGHSRCMPRCGRPYSTAGVAIGSQLRLRFEQEVRLLKKARAQIARRDQRIQVRKDEIKRLDQEIQSLRTIEEEVHGLCNRTKNLETLMEAEVDIKRVAKAKNAELTEELESLRAQFSDLQVNNNQLSQQVFNLQAQVTGNEKIKAAFEDFKKYEDDKVEQRHRWVIGHGIRLAVMKCSESTELRKVFANVVSAGIAKGMSEGLKHRVEHGKANLDLAAIEAYDPEADAKYVVALHALKDLRYPLVDQLEKLKDAPIDLIMASLHLESDAGEDTPQWVRDLSPNSSQLKIPVYPEVSDPKNPWDFKEEILLEDAIATNISRAEKKKCRVVCRTHGVGSAHHARSDGVPVSMPTVAPQGLAILLADAATQTETSEDEASPSVLHAPWESSLMHLTSQVYADLGHRIRGCWG
ncbi:hypothetical protein Tco_0227371 [Tanacetum coccineum]